MSALIMRHCVFLHVPKCGGTWAIEALRNQGIVIATLRDANGADHPNLSTVVQAIDTVERPVIATVREPVSWLVSFWRFFYARNWRPSSQGTVASMEPLLSMASPSFSEFAARYLNRRPGYITELFKSYADGADYVCRQEYLAADLAKSLTACGQPFNQEVLTSTPRRNVSSPFNASCSSATMKGIREADKWIIETHYAGRNADHTNS